MPALSQLLSHVFLVAKEDNVFPLIFRDIILKLQKIAISTDYNYSIEIINSPHHIQDNFYINITFPDNMSAAKGSISQCFLFEGYRRGNVSDKILCSSVVCI